MAKLTIKDILEGSKIILGPNGKVCGRAHFMCPLDEEVETSLTKIGTDAIYFGNSKIRKFEFYINGETFTAIPPRPAPVETLIRIVGDSRQPAQPDKSGNVHQTFETQDKAEMFAFTLNPYSYPIILHTTEGWIVSAFHDKGAQCRRYEYAEKFADVRYKFLWAGEE